MPFSFSWNTGFAPPRTVMYLVYQQSPMQDKNELLTKEESKSALGVLRFQSLRFCRRLYLSKSVPALYHENQEKVYLPFSFGQLRMFLFFVSKNVVFHLFFENIFVVKLKSTKQCRMPSTTHDCLKNRGCQPTRLSYKWNQNFIFVRNEIFKTKINRLNFAPIAMHCNGIYILDSNTLNC